MSRQTPAALLLIALAALLAGRLAGGPEVACAMCSKECRCGSGPAKDHCFLKRPCHSEAPAESSTSPAVGKAALLPAPVGPSPHPRRLRLAMEGAQTPLDLPTAPPDPPPRASC
ncbi:MAG TPA: hypothetical protein VGK94_08610 [Candidatus Polarisedimenticolia bacterium]|jgi:hypothetical protein